MGENRRKKKAAKKLALQGGRERMLDVIQCRLISWRDYMITHVMMRPKVRDKRARKQLRQFVRRNFGEGQVISPRVDRKFVLYEGDYMVAVPQKDGKTVRVMIISPERGLFRPRRGVRITVPLWSTKQWGHYMEHCISNMRAGYSLDLETIMKEK